MLTPRDILGNIAAGKVLDVATGNGNFIGFLLEGAESYDEITGIDTSEKGVPAFTENFKGNQNVHFAKMDAARMDFPDASFDTVCISNSLHHMPDLAAALAEMKRVLRPGGYFIVAEMYRDNQTDAQLTHVLMHHWWASVDMAMGTLHHETYTRQQILDILLSLGLQKLAIHDLSDLTEDPKNPETAKYLLNVVDQYLKRIEGLPEEALLRARGLELRRRVEEIGFHSATSLLLIGRKH